MACLSPALTRARAWGDCALTIAFPWPESEGDAPVPIEAPFCRQCGYPYAELPGNDLPFVCSHCAGRHWYFKWARAAYRSEVLVHVSVAGFKYRVEYYQLSRLVVWLTEAFDHHAADAHWDALVPVPLYHRRLRTRGFNQARELARGLGHARSIAVCDCLYRERETPCFADGLSPRHARWENMEGAFRLKGRFDVQEPKFAIDRRCLYDRRHRPTPAPAL